MLWWFGIASLVIIDNVECLWGNVRRLPSATIDHNVVAAASSAVVIKYVADNSLVAGVLAKLLKDIPDDVD